MQGILPPATATLLGVALIVVGVLIAILALRQYARFPEVRRNPRLTYLQFTSDMLTSALAVTSGLSIVMQGLAHEIVVTLMVLVALAFSVVGYLKIRIRP